MTSRFRSEFKYLVLMADLDEKGALGQTVSGMFSNLELQAHLQQGLHFWLLDRTSHCEPLSY